MACLKCIPGLLWALRPVLHPVSHMDTLGSPVRRHRCGRLLRACAATHCGCSSSEAAHWRAAEPGQGEHCSHSCGWAGACSGRWGWVGSVFVLVMVRLCSFLGEGGGRVSVCRPLCFTATGLQNRCLHCSPLPRRVQEGGSEAGVESGSDAEAGTAPDKWAATSGPPTAAGAAATAGAGAGAGARAGAPSPAGLLPPLLPAQPAQAPTQPTAGSALSLRPPPPPPSEATSASYSLSETGILTPGFCSLLAQQGNLGPNPPHLGPSPPKHPILAPGHPESPDDVDGLLRRLPASDWQRSVVDYARITFCRWDCCERGRWWLGAGRAPWSAVNGGR